MKMAARLVAPMVAVLALVGCSPSAKTAAVVDGTSITEAQVNAAFASCESFDIPWNRTQVMFYLLLDEYVDAITERLGEPIDPAVVEEVIASDPSMVSLMGTPCEQAVNGYIKPQMLTLDVALHKELLEGIEVMLNPRYGSWDPYSGLDSTGGSLSVLEEGTS